MSFTSTIFPDEDTAHAITVFPAFGGDGEQKSGKKACGKPAICSQKDEQDNRIYHLHLTGEGAGAGKTTACRTKLFYQ